MLLFKTTVLSLKNYPKKPVDKIYANLKKQSRLLRSITWVNIVFQLLFPLSLYFSPLMIMANNNATSFSDKNTHYFEEKTADTQLATVVMKTGSLLSSSNTTDAAINMARSALLTQANTSIQQWLKQFGTARVQFNVNDHFHLKGSALDLLLPLYDSPQSMLFTQLGARNKDSRNTVNIGMGIRTWQNHWLFGMNTFFDQDVTNKNRRLGIGAEIWTDHLKLSANHYVAITDWHSSADFADYRANNI